MGNQINAKQLRGQLRQIVKELFPELMSSEVINALDEKLTKRITDKLELVNKNVADTLGKIDERAKDIQSYLVRQVTAAPLGPDETQTLEPQPVETPKTE